MGRKQNVLRYVVILDLSNCCQFSWACSEIHTGNITMAKQKNKERDSSVDEILSLIDRDIAQGRVMPADAEYFHRLRHLVEGVTVDLDQRLPDEDL
jgi:hypothetical protein